MIFVSKLNSWVVGSHFFYPKWQHEPLIFLSKLASIDLNLAKTHEKKGWMSLENSKDIDTMKSRFWTQWRKQQKSLVKLWWHGYNHLDAGRYVDNLCLSWRYKSSSSRPSIFAYFSALYLHVLPLQVEKVWSPVGT